ncbi:MAG: PHP domain-containing protein [Candidatus Tectomicrobia bacterium]|uniref:PHP domain-containing protein n=1 Tax=Tectimicrobiota bacterium TaxID=2528274 RepID=A0A933LR74_UNCTE|nr:PHP domain-containing protein [Candidatus Tectomicrobia bacterium]
MILETHCHTRFGSACSYMSPEELVQQAKRLGLDGVCITEHDNPWDLKSLKELSERYELLVLAGIEVPIPFGEVLVFGIHEHISHNNDPDKLRSQVEMAGGVMVAAHPFRGDNSLFEWDASCCQLVPLVDKACRRPILDIVDAMEVFNGRSPDWEVDLSVAVGKQLSIKGTGGSDAHNVDQVGECVTIFEKHFQKEEDFLNELREGRYRAIHRPLNQFY